MKSKFKEGDRVILKDFQTLLKEGMQLDEDGSYYCPNFGDIIFDYEIELCGKVLILDRIAKRDCGKRIFYLKVNSQDDHHSVEAGESWLIPIPEKVSKVLFNED